MKVCIGQLWSRPFPGTTVRVDFQIVDLGRIYAVVRNTTSRAKPRTILKRRLLTDRRYRLEREATP